MSDSFDPYLKWLGIRDRQRPPNHYRLLGILPLEDDLDVIASAADRQMAHVRRFQHGEHLELSQRLLNELAAARVCLLNQDKKLQYDEQLRRRNLRRHAFTLVTFGLVGILFLILTTVLLMNWQTNPQVDDIESVHSDMLENAPSITTTLSACGEGQTRDTIAGCSSVFDKETPPWKQMQLAAEAKLTIPLKWQELQPCLNRLCERDLMAASHGIEQASKNDFELEHVDEIQRFNRYLIQLTRHWQFFQEGVQTLKPNEELVYWRSRVTVVSVTAKEIDVEAVGGQRRTFQLAREQVDPYLAAGITLHAMRNSGAMACFVVGTFLALDQMAKDKSLALDYLRLAAEQAIPVCLLSFQELEDGIRFEPVESSYANQFQLPEANETPEIVGDKSSGLRPNEPVELTNGSPTGQAATDSVSVEENETTAATASVELPKVTERTSSVSSEDNLADHRTGSREKNSNEKGNTTQESAVAKVKAPIPQDEELELAEKRVSNTYRVQLSDREPTAQLELYRKLISSSRVSENDAVRYVLLWKAVSIAAELGYFELAFATMNQLGDYFDLDILQEKKERIEYYSKRNYERRNPNGLLRVMWKTAQQAATMDRWDIAEQTVEDAIDIAKKIRQYYLAEMMKLDMVRYQYCRKLFNQLPESPLPSNVGEDRLSNQMIGEYLCFVKNDFAKGLAFLARGNDDRLAAIAKMDRANPDTGTIRRDLGDQWLKIGRKYDEPICQAGAYRRAHHWYGRCLPKLKGLAYDEVRQKIQEIDRDLFPGTLDHTQFAAVFSSVSQMSMSEYQYTGDMPITVEAFVRPTETANSKVLETIIGNSDDGGWSLAAQMGKWWFRFHDGTSFKYTFSNNPLDLNRWIHLACVFDGRQVRMYVDGRRQQRISWVDRHRPSRGNVLAVGAAPNVRIRDASSFHGQLREVRVSLSARYMSTQFVPPSGLALDADTVVLLPLNGSRRQFAVDVANSNRTVRADGITLIRLGN